MTYKYPPKSDFTIGQIVAVNGKNFPKPRQGVVLEVKDHYFSVMVEHKSTPVKFSRYTQSAFTKGWWV